MIDPDDLDRVLDRELKQLPGPRAPQTLLPRVMAAAAQARVPWYRQPWVAWPADAQTASVAVLLVVLAGLAAVFPSVQHASGVLTSALARTVPATVVDVFRWAREGAALMNIVFQVLLQPVAAYVFALAIALSVACGAFVSALDRVALGGASHQ